MWWSVLNFCNKSYEGRTRLFFINVSLVGCRLKMLRNGSNMMIYGGRAVQDVSYSKHFSLSTLIYDFAITHCAGAHRGQHMQLISEMWAGLWQSWQKCWQKIIYGFNVPRIGNLTPRIRKSFFFFFNSSFRKATTYLFPSWLCFILWVCECHKCYIFPQTVSHGTGLGTRTFGRQ